MSSIAKAMVLAAGFGQRMRPLTLTTPKPLIKVNGVPLIGHVMQRLREADVREAVVNAHYLADQIVAWSKTVESPRITISDETDAILDTGGGIVRALSLLGDQPFFVMNSDSFWVDKGTPALARLREAWDETRMDCLLLLCDPLQTTGYDGDGDFVLGADGRLTRGRSLAYIGGYIVHPRLFENPPPDAFSMNRLWDRAISTGRLYGLAHHGHWLHVGTPEAIGDAEAYLNRM